MVVITHAPRLRHLNRLLVHCHRRRYTTKSTVIYTGDHCETLFFITKGSTTTPIEDNDGREMIISYLNSGNSFGGLGLLEKEGSEWKCSVWVYAKVGCEVAKISYTKFHELSRQGSETPCTLGGQMAGCLRRAIRRMGGLTFFDVAGCVARTLPDLCRRPDVITHPDDMQVKITRQGIGRIAGYSREVVGCVLKSLEEQGLMHVEGKTMVVSGTR